MLAVSEIKPAGLEGCKGISEFYGKPSAQQEIFAVQLSSLW